MFKKFLILIMPLVLVCVFLMNATAQSDTKEYNFKKGEILDLLFLTTKPDTKANFDRYKKTVFPVGFKFSYQSQPGFGITSYVEGNHHPSGLVLGKWNSLVQREQFLTNIVKEVPDFHEQRRALFSFFGLTYYEMQADMQFQVRGDKYNVVTAYWKARPKDFERFVNDFKTASKKAGGSEIIELTGGESPFGYYYQPDFLVVTEWENQAAFEAFHKTNKAMDTKGVLHVNQFVIN